MIKCVFIKSHDLKAAAVMFAMAGKTIFSGYLTGNVVSFALVNTHLEFLVTLQAFIVRHFITEIVTLGTIHDTLEMGVIFREIAG